jgi:rare lipoprotein A
MRKFIVGAFAPLLLLCGVTAEAAPFSAIASWYGPGFHGRTTANGERYNRGPFIGPRAFDLSRGAADRVGLTGPGVATLQFEII